jgi:hypothetical protein
MKTVSFLISKVIEHKALIMIKSRFGKTNERNKEFICQRMNFFERDFSIVIKSITIYGFMVKKLII